MHYVHTYAGEPLSTVGVDLGIWKYRKDLEKRLIRSVKTMRSVTFYTWDFGGQVSYTFMYISNQGEIRQKALEKKRPTIFSLHMQTAIVSTPNVSENMCMYSAHNASVYNSLLSCKACGMWFLYDTRTFQCP